MITTVVGLLLLATAGVQAEDSPPSQPSAEEVEKRNIATAFAMTRDAAGKYEFSTRVGEPAAVLREQPILRWSNPERGQIYGNVFLWTDRGRPLMVGSLFKWFSPHVARMNSIDLTVDFDSRQAWHCDLLPSKEVSSHKLPYTSFYFANP